MPLVWVAVAIALMLVLVLVVKLDAFFALILTAFAVGLLNGMDVLAALQSVLRGIGGTLGNVVLILVFGAMLGKLVDESGAAHLLEQEPRRPGADGRLPRLGLGEAGQHEAGQPRHPLAQRPAQVRTAAVGQPHVEDDDVGPHGRHAGQRLGDRPGLARHQEVRIVLQHLGDPAADHLVVVDEEHPHGRAVGHRPPPL